MDTLLHKCHTFFMHQSISERKTSPQMIDRRRMYANKENISWSLLTKEKKKKSRVCYRKVDILFNFTSTTEKNGYLPTTCYPQTAQTNRNKRNCKPFVAPLKLNYFQPKISEPNEHTGNEAPDRSRRKTHTQHTGQKPNRPCSLKRVGKGFNLPRSQDVDCSSKLFVARGVKCVYECVCVCVCVSGCMCVR